MFDHCKFLNSGILHFICLECADDLNEAGCKEVVNKCLHECGRCQKDNVTPKPSTDKPTEPAKTTRRPFNSTDSPSTGKTANDIKNVMKYKNDLC